MFPARWRNLESEKLFSSPTASKINAKKTQAKSDKLYVKDSIWMALSFDGGISLSEWNFYVFRVLLVHKLNYP